MEPAFAPVTDICRREQHCVVKGEAITAPAAAQKREVEFCLTCAEEQGRARGLAEWKHACPCCYSENN